MHADLSRVLGDERAVLLAERALWLPARQALLIADLHLGKGDAFRQAGIALPRGGTAHDLQRLQQLLQYTQATQVWILGDMLHGAQRQSAWLQQWRQWRQQHRHVEVHVVRGNHDRALHGDAFAVTVHETEATLGHLRLRHEPVDDASGHVIAGHLHPQARVPGLPRRWPAFWLRPHSTILPAFSAFTAGVLATPAKGEQLVACVQGHAIALPVS